MYRVQLFQQSLKGWSDSLLPTASADWDISVRPAWHSALVGFLYFGGK